MHIYFRTLFIATLFFASFNMQAQEVEFGLTGGVSLYSGDLSPKEFGLYLDDINAFGGLYLRYRPVNRLALRLGANFTKVSATADAPEGSTGIGRALNFRSSVTELTLIGELDLFYIGGGPKSNHLAPYVFGGGSLNFINPEGNLDGVWYELQPLATEGQGIGREPYDAAPYSLTEFTLHFGGGLRWRLSERVVLGGEIGGRWYRSDYLDDVSNTVVNYLDILENTGPVAAQLSNPSVENPSTTEDLLYVRGGEFADWLFTGGITLGIILGEGGGGGRGKTGCYQF